MIINILGACKLRQEKVNLPVLKLKSQKVKKQRLEPRAYVSEPVLILQDRMGVADVAPCSYSPHLRGLM